MASVLPVRPIYDNRGKLKGIEDPNKGVSRLPTDQEKLVYSKPSAPSSRGGGSSSRNYAPQQVSAPKEPTSNPVTEKLKSLAPSPLEQLQRGQVQQQTQKLAVNLPQYGGVYTSTGKFYPTSDPNYLPKGYEQGYADIRKEGISIVSKTDVPYTKATQEGTVVTKPIEEPDVTKNLRYNPELAQAGTAGIKTPTVEEQITQIAQAPAEIGEIVGKGYTKLLKENLGFVNKYVVSPSKEIAVGQRVTSGGQDYSKIKFLNPKVEVGAEDVGTAIGFGTELSLYATPAGAASLGASGVKGGIKFFTAKTPTEKLSGVTEVGVATLGLSLPRAIEGVGKLFGRKVTVVEKVFETKPKEMNFILGVPKEEVRIELPTGGYKYQYQYPIIGQGLETSLGRKVIVKESTLFKEIIGFKPKEIYSGNPRTDQEGYRAALDKLTGSREIDKYFRDVSGKVSRGRAKDVLRYTKPTVTEVNYGGIANVELYPETDRSNIFLSGVYYKKPVSIKTPDVSTRLGPTAVYRPEGIGFKIGTLKEAEYYKSLPTYVKSFQKIQGKEYQKLSQAGKTSESFLQISGAKQIDEGLIPLPIGKTGVTNLAQAKLYQERSIMRRTLPSGRLGRKEFLGSSKLYVLEGEPIVKIDVPSPFKIETISDKPIETFSGSFSNQQAKEITKTLRDIYGPQIGKSIGSNIPKIPIKTKIFNALDLGKVKVSNVFNIAVARTKKLGNVFTPKETVVVKEVFAPKVSYPSSKSEFVGTGKYERTEGGLLPGELSVNISRVNNRVRTVSDYIDNTTTKTNTGLRILSGNRSTQQEKQVFQFKQIPQERLAEQNKVSFQERLAQQQRLSQQQKFVQQQRFATSVNNRLRKTTNLLKFKDYSKKTDNSYDEIKSSFNQKKSNTKSEFLALTKRFGKQKIIGKFRTEKEAIGFGTKNIKSNLARSLKVVESKSGRTVKLPLLLGFRQSKKDPFTLVQSNALGSLSETKEIQSFRKGRNVFI